MTTRADIIAEARSWLGTRWHHQASVKGLGCDCIGFVAGVARECGLPEGLAFSYDRGIQGYGRTPDPEMLLRACDAYLDRKPAPWAILPADVLLMKFDKEPQHFGLVTHTTPLTMIHAYAGCRRVVEHLMGELWTSRLTGVYSYRGLA